MATTRQRYAENAEDGRVLDLGELLSIVWRRRWLVAIVIVSFVGIATAYSLSQTPIYQASVKLVIGQEQNEAASFDLGGAVAGLQQVTVTATELVDSRPIVNAVIRRLDLRTTPEQLARGLNAEVVGTTLLIQIDYEDTDPERAQLVANTTAQVFAEEFSKLSPSFASITATVSDPAEVPTSPVSPDTVLNIFAALVLGTMVGVGLALLLEYSNSTLRSSEEVEVVSGAPVLGAIPRLAPNYRLAGGLTPRVRNRKGPRRALLPSGKGSSPTEKRSLRATRKDAILSESLITALDPDSSATEAYRTLRTNISYSSHDDPPKATVVTSPTLHDGASVVSANLGVVLAQAHKTSLVLDCNLRQPTMHKIFDLRNPYGLVDILSRDSSIEEVCQEPLPRLQVITAGAVPPDPAELLFSERFAEFLKHVRREFDFIIINAPPIVPASETIILAIQGDGVLLVLNPHESRVEPFRQSVRRLEAVGANILGTVMTDVPGHHSVQAVS
jgi:capsular exopolysaccharide synthesis family protein